MTNRITSTGILTVISHPLVLSLFALVLTLLVYPLEFRKYNLELVRSKQYNDIYRNSEYRDINGDGINERVHTQNLITNASIIAFTQFESIYETWNLPGFWYTVPDYIFGDIDSDGIEEMYCISVSPGDSVLVSQVELSGNPGIIKSKFVARLSRINGELDHMVKECGFIDVTGDSIPDFVFLITAGFSLQPRAYYAWDLKKDSVIRTPLAGMNFRDILMETSMDLHEDSGTRIFTDVFASHNYADSVAYSDTASYAVLLTNNLEYLFDPVYTGGAQSITTTVPFTWKGKNQVLAVTHDKRKVTGKTSLRVIDNSGTVIREKENIELSKSMVPFIWNGQVCLLETKADDFSIHEIGPDLNVSEVYSHEGAFVPVKILDFNADESDELLLKESMGQTFAILDDKLQSLTTVDLDEIISPVSTMSIKSMDQDHCEIFIQTFGHSYLLNYSRNSLYPFRWASYVLIYLIYSAIFLGLQKLFVFRIKKKKALEDKVVNLQLQSVMNQLNPHFTFNAINSIGHAVLEGKNIEAYEYFTSLSDLIRKSMTNAFEPYKTLESEVEFVKQYLHIEAYRYNGKLSSEFYLDPLVDTEIIIPKMLIHLFVENAIKHGIFHNEEGGKINISINKTSIGVLIMVVDDGVGMSKAFEIEQHLGEGLKILDNYLQLFNRQHKHSVSYHILDRTDQEAGQTGTRVLITIKL